MDVLRHDLELFRTLLSSVHREKNILLTTIEQLQAENTKLKQIIQYHEEKKKWSGFCQDQAETVSHDIPFRSTSSQFGVLGPAPRDVTSPFEPFPTVLAPNNTPITPNAQVKENHHLHMANEQLKEQLRNYGHSFSEPFPR